MPYEPERDPYFFLLDVIKEIHEPRVRRSFSDALEADGYPSFDNPRHVLAYACTLLPTDTDTMTLFRLLLYYLLIHKARDLHPTMFVIPEDNFHDSVVFKPQLQLLFEESRLSAANVPRRPVRSQASIRLMNVNPTEITTQEVDNLAQKIWNAFVLPNPYKYTKGELLGRYLSKEQGYDLRILGDTEETIRAVITKIIGLNSHELEDQYFTISSSFRTFPTPEESVTILGKEYQKPIQRPTTEVHFVRAELKLFGMRASKLLVARYDHCDTQCSRIF